MKALFCVSLPVLCLLFAPVIAGSDDTTQPAKTDRYTITWTKHEVAGPAARVWTAMEYDPGKKKIVLFGGLNNMWPMEYYGDTWTWNGKRWRKMKTIGSPSPRYGHTLVYDEQRGELVLFGGYDGTNKLNDTWVFSGRTWTQKTPSTSPPERLYHAMAYDSAAGVGVLIGGNQLSTTDTWTWDGTDWTDVTPTDLDTSMPSRNGSAMSYNRKQGYSVMFGGEVYPGRGGWVANETWQWDGAAWTKIATRKTPKSSDDRKMVYHEGTENILMFGGSYIAWDFDQMYWEPTAELWRYTGKSWALLWPRKNTGTGRVDALKRRRHAVAYDAARDELVVFGGMDRHTLVPNTTWTCTIEKK